MIMCMCLSSADKLSLLDKLIYANAVVGTRAFDT